MKATFAEDGVMSQAAPARIAPPAADFSLCVLSATEALADPNLPRDWDQCASMEQPDATRQTIAWIEHLMANGRKARVAMVRDGSAQPAGYVPLLEENQKLTFAVRGKVLFNKRFNALSIAGSLPMLPEDTRTYDLLFSWIRQHERRCGCVFMLSVPLDSYLWNYLQTADEIRNHWALYTPTGPYPYYSLVLPDSFSDYLSRWDKKSRYNLRRTVKCLEQHGDGQLGLLRVDKSGQIDEFLTDALHVSGNSWQRVLLTIPLAEPADRRTFLDEAAQSGILRSYVLKCGGVACAFVVGLQSGSVFHYFETAYDQAFAQYSPGKVITYLLIEDLFAHDKPRMLAFGKGDMDYKEWFSNRRQEETSIFLFRPTLRNLTWRGAHRLFDKGVCAAKRLLGRRAAGTKS